MLTCRGTVKDGVILPAKPLPDGTVVDIVPHTVDTDERDADHAALVARGRELVRRARERNRDVPEEVIEQEVERAVVEVRARGRS